MLSQYAGKIQMVLKTDGVFCVDTVIFVIFILQLFRSFHT
ncbi:hypothetical protein X975_08736, partial [Stegodyphus mimosarum]